MKRIISSTERRYTDKAARLVNAIAGLAASDYALDNFESYVAQHGDEWYNRYAKDLNGLISELEQFSDISE